MRKTMILDKTMALNNVQRGKMTDEIKRKYPYAVTIPLSLRDRFIYDCTRRLLQNNHSIFLEDTTLRPDDSTPAIAIHRSRF